MELEKIQQEIRSQNLDGWLFFDHHVRDPLAYRVLGFQPQRTPTRRWYYLVPANGEPRRLVHRIESTMLDALPGELLRQIARTRPAQARLVDSERGDAALAHETRKPSPRCFDLG